MAIRDVLAGSNAEHIVASIQTTPGECRWFSACVAGVIINGQRGAVIVHDDVTDRWKAEHFEPSEWCNDYPNPAFVRMTEELTGSLSWPCIACMDFRLLSLKRPSRS